MTGAPARAPAVLQQLFRGHQEVLQAELTLARQAIGHPTLKGDASESSWGTMLSRHLPRRYRACRGVVVDSAGGVSDQIDIIVHDAQYCPLFNESANACFVPAESVYGVFEVKQEIPAAYVAEAGRKVASVRRLRRTSAPIVDRGLEREARVVSPILGGILALEATWTDGFGESFKTAMSQLDSERQLDIGCAVTAGYFELPTGAAPDELVTCGAELAVARFFLRLVHRLQRLGTVSAIDWTAYAAALDA
jgi:hypothetical protein